MATRKLSRLLAATLCALFLGAPVAAAEGRWLRGESQHFIFYSEGSESNLRKIAETLERFDTLLRALSQPAERLPPPKLEVYLFRNRSGLRAVWPKIPDQVGGFYSTGAEMVAAFAVHPDDGDLLDREVLLHEYAHHFMLHYFASAYPAWYVEGFAEYLQTARFERERVVIGEPSTMRAGALLARGSGLPVRQILVSPAQGLDDRATQQFYAQSWLITHYILGEAERYAALRTYLNALAGGADPISAFEPSFGMSVDAFGDALNVYKRGQIAAFAYVQPLNANISVQISRLPEAADRLLPLNARLRRPVPREERAELVQEVAEAARGHAGDPYAQRTIAYAALAAQEPLRARSILEPLIAANGDDAQALHLMGLTYNLEALLGPPEKWMETITQGRRYFARASRIEPNNFSILWAYAVTYMHLPGRMSDNTLDVLIKAHLLAPQVHEIGLSTGRELMEAGLFDEAVPILRRIAFAPHAKGINEQAQMLLDLALIRHAPLPFDADARQSGSQQGESQ